MKPTAVTILAAMLLAICAGCGVGPAEPRTASSMTTEPFPLGKPTKTDQLSQDQVAAHAQNGFAIYLLIPNALHEGPASVDPSDLEGRPFLSIDDIVSYTWATHEMELTELAYERVRNLAIPLQGEGFAVCVDGWPVYTGAFWNAYSSLVFEGAFIDLVHPTREHPVMQIRLGYPSSAFFRGEDRRSDPRIFRALRARIIVRSH